MQRYRALRQLVGHARACVLDSGSAPALSTTGLSAEAGTSAGAPAGASQRRMPYSRHQQQQDHSAFTPHACRAITTSAAAFVPRGGGGGGEGPGGEVTEAEAAEAMREIAEAFQRLVEAAWGLAQKGQPLEAEALLSEGAPLPPPAPAPQPAPPLVSPSDTPNFFGPSQP